jgi:hypothetical protein
VKSEGRKCRNAYKLSVRKRLIFSLNALFGSLSLVGDSMILRTFIELRILLSPISSGGFPRSGFRTVCNGKEREG